MTLVRLLLLGAHVVRCPRRADDPPGDPCVLRFREAVAAGAIPFAVQSSRGGRLFGVGLAIAIMGGYLLVDRAALAFVSLRGLAERARAALPAPAGADLAVLGSGRGAHVVVALARRVSCESVVNQSRRAPQGRFAGGRTFRQLTGSRSELSVRSSGATPCKAGTLPSHHAQTEACRDSSIPA